MLFLIEQKSKIIMMKLLITSVGSLLGQNILESIESRRNLIEVIGINSTVGNTRNY